MMTADQLRGRCPVCDRDMLLKKDGTLRHHGGPIGTGGIFRKRAYLCDGAGQPPITNRDNESGSR